MANLKCINFYEIKTYLSFFCIFFGYNNFLNQGGYCIESLAEGAALTLRCLLGDPCPRLIDPIMEPSERLYFKHILFKLN